MTTKDLILKVYAKKFYGNICLEDFRDNGLCASCIKFVSCNECPCQDLISPGAVAQWT